MNLLSSSIPNKFSKLKFNNMVAEIKQRTELGEKKMINWLSHAVRVRFPPWVHELALPAQK
jgi:hypothetical protein